MFEALEQAAAAWRTIAHVSEWTGLSVGALAVIGAFVAYNPRLLKPAIAAAVAVGIAYAGTLYGAGVGRAEIEAQWADARTAAIDAEHERDQMAEQQLQAKYGPRLAELQTQAADNKRKADDYERKLLAGMAKAAVAKTGGTKSGGACELGAAADRMHGSQRQARDLREGRRPPRGRPAGGV
ncbi:hypothetical protein ACVWXN_003452 [Bradyrhizobium sp. i1.4.4]